MLNLDEYIDNDIEMQLFGKVIHVKEPSVRMIEKIEKIEVDLNKDNETEKRVEVALLMINYNKENITFEREEMKVVPYEGIVEIINVVGRMKLKADLDPNLESPSQEAK